MKDEEQKRSLLQMLVYHFDRDERMGVREQLSSFGIFDLFFSLYPVMINTHCRMNLLLPYFGTTLPNLVQII